MSEKAAARKRKREYYVKAARGKRSKYQHTLEPGLKGFLLTCNNREKEAIRDAYNILNEYADEIIGPADKKPAESQTPETDDDCSGSDEEDIEAALKKELSSLKSKPKEQQRFQVADTGANNCIFIKTTVDKPDVFTHKIFSDLHKSKSSKSRFIMRMLPVIGTCRAEDDKIDKLASDLLPEYFGTGEAKSYCVLSKIRNNSSFGKHQAMPILRRLIMELNPQHSFDPDNPDYIISMDIIKSVCCMSVMKDFVKFRKYNIQEVVKAEEKKPEKNAEKCAEYLGPGEEAGNNEVFAESEKIEGKPEESLVSEVEPLKKETSLETTQAAESGNVGDVLIGEEKSDEKVAETNGSDVKQDVNYAGDDVNEKSRNTALDADKSDSHANGSGSDEIVSTEVQNEGKKSEVGTKDENNLK